MTGAGVVASDDRTRRRPMRACTARTPARLAPPAPLPARKGTVKKFVPVEKSPPSSQPFTPIVLSSSPLPAQEARFQLRSMWELASVLHFLNVFRPVLGIVDEFSGEELESALLSPNNRLGNIHIILLKAVPPVHRSPLNLETWVTILTKKLQNWWPWVVEGPCPLVPSHGQEMAAYEEFDPRTRLIILKALCEIRLDQEDVRSYIEQSIKQGHPVSNFRLERTGPDMFGTTYWYFDDPILGSRLCRDTRVDMKVKGRVRARDYPPPVAGQWETLAVKYEEFHFVAEQLTLSTQRLEAALGKRITMDILPELDEMQKRKERKMKKQHRQAVLLDNLIQGNGLAAGRSHRNRKPVNYTFDDYDRSINEAIMFTKFKKRQSSPDQAHPQDMEVTHDRSNGANGYTSIKSFQGPIKNGNQILKGEGVENISLGRRQTRKSQRYSESEYTVGTFDDDAETSSGEEIEGEAIYDDNYLRAKKRRKKQVPSSEEGEGDDDEDYRGDEAEEAYLDDDFYYYSDGDEDGDGPYHSNSRQQRQSGKRKRKESKLKPVDDLEGGLSWGLRRSKRATKNEVDYSKCGDSELEDDGNAIGFNSSRGEQERIRETSSLAGDSDASFGPSNDSQGGRESDADSEGFQEEVKTNKSKLNDLHDRIDVRLSHPHDADDEKPGMRSSVIGVMGQQQHAASFLRAEHSNGGNQPTRCSSHFDVKPRRFLDLNVAASAGGGFEDTAGGCPQVSPEGHGDDRSDDDDDNYFGDGGRVDVSVGYTSNGFAPSSSFGTKRD